MSKKRLLLAGALLLLGALACSLLPPQQPPAEQTPDSNQIATIVAQTLAAAMTENAPPATAPPPTATPPATQAPTCQPAHPGSETTVWPVGFAVSDRGENITFYDTQGNLLATHTLPGLSYSDVNSIHFGALSGGPSIAYHYTASGPINQVDVYRNQQVQSIWSDPDIAWIGGAPGSEHLLIVTAGSNPSQTGWQSNFFTADAQALTVSPTPFLTRDQQDSLIFYPLAAWAPNGQLQGAWYTLVMWGVGDIVWAPSSGLYYYDFGQQQTTEFIPTTGRFAGLSPDHTLAAFVANISPTSAGAGLTIRDMAGTCQDIFIPWDTASNLGGGSAKFSPDNHYLVWMEAGGEMMAYMDMRLRIGILNNGTYTDLVNTPVSQLSTLTGGETPSSVAPLAWVNDHVLLLSIYIGDSNTPMLVLWAPDPGQPLDPALGTHQAVAIGEGYFAGLLYP